MKFLFYIGNTLFFYYICMSKSLDILPVIKQGRKMYEDRTRINR